MLKVLYLCGISGKLKLKFRVVKKTSLCYDFLARKNQKQQRGLYMRMTILQENEQDCKLEIIEGTGEVLEDFSGTGRKRPWSERKRESVELLNLFQKARELDDKVISPSRFTALKDCASWLQYAQQADGTRKLANANFCRLRLCPMCGWRKSLKLFSQVSRITDAILAEKKARFIFVTLTVENVKGEELRATIKRMNEGFKCLVQDKKGMAASATFRANLMGYMKAIEVTYNAKRNDFHPHIHCIFEVRPSYFDAKRGGYLTHEDWREMWRSVMKLDYEPQVDVRAIKNTTAKAVAEVAKYPVKVDGLLKVKDKEKAAQALIQLKHGIHNCRFITFGGDFREYKRRLTLDDIETGDLVHVETDKQELNAVAMILFKYRANVGAYIC